VLLTQFGLIDGMILTLHLLRGFYKVSRLCHLEMASVSQVLGPGGSKMKSSVQQVIAGTKYKIGKLGV